MQGFRRKLTPGAIKDNCKAAYKAITSVHAAKKLLKKRKPDVVVGTGGYVSWPTVKAAAKMGIPCLIHEQNTFPGVTTKKLAHYASIVCISFEGSERFFAENERYKILLTGNPIHVDTITREQARAKLGLSPDEPYILSFGGSMGARFVNEQCFALMESYSVPNGIRHDHAIGRVGFKEFSARAKECGLDKRDNVTLAEYFYDMPYRQAAADIIICEIFHIIQPLWGYCFLLCLSFPEKVMELILKASLLSWMFLAGESQIYLQVYIMALLLGYSI